MKYTAEQIKELRKRENITQEELAEKLDVSRELINKVETGNLPVSKALNILLTKNFVSREKNTNKSGGSLTAGETASALIRIEAMLGVVIDAQAEQLASMHDKMTVSEVRSSLAKAVQQREEEILKARNAGRTS